MHPTRTELLEMISNARHLKDEDASAPLSDVAALNGRFGELLTSHICLLGIVKGLLIDRYPTESERVLDKAVAVVSKRQAKLLDDMEHTRMPPAMQRIDEAAGADYRRHLGNCVVNPALAGVPRTDEQIVAECNEFAVRLLCEVWGYALSVEPMLTYQERDPRVKHAWQCAVIAFDHFQQTPADEALSNIQEQ